MASSEGISELGNANMMLINSTEEDVSQADQDVQAGYVVPALVALLRNDNPISLMYCLNSGTNSA